MSRTSLGESHRESRLSILNEPTGEPRRGCDECDGEQDKELQGTSHVIHEVKGHVYSGVRC